MFLVVQLSDPHIGADWGVREPIDGLEAVVGAVGAMRPQPDVVLITGDLTDHAADAEYEQVKTAVAAIDAPLYVLPGNHDGRTAMRRNFDLPGTGEDVIQYSADLGPLRLVALDSTIPGEDGGVLDAERLAWLDAELAAEPQAPTIVALHHSPLSTGIPVMDEFRLAAASKSALGEVIERHPQVCGLVGGHLHRTITGSLAGRPVFCAPSTYVQMRLDFEAKEVQLATEPPAFAVHAFLDGELLSHVRPVVPR